ncbi:MAG: 30S ribosomal protein S17 [Lentisphaeria bacterium]|nr:30S ribosomal protein S17 [Lentisphaeria bacterium]NQZ67480.1 30S ribosomal protein S17 [Lentisphaeria bacterium]
MSEAVEEKRGLRKERVGLVTSDVQDLTIVVRVDRRAAHKQYKKVITHSKKYHVHDAENVAKKGDLVKIVETRPISKLKRWRLIEVVRKFEG